MGKINFTKTIRIAALVLADAILFNLSYILAYLVRFEMDANAEMFAIHFPSYVHNFVFLTLIKLVIFFILGMYRSLWVYAGSEELLKIVGTSLVASLGAIAFLILSQQNPAMPRSIYILSFIFDTIFAGGVRFTYRYLRATRNRRRTAGLFTPPSSRKAARRKPGGESGGDIAVTEGPIRVLLVGAGDAGAILIREIKTNQQQNRRVEAAVDDDPAKRGQTILGVKIAGDQHDIPLLARRYDIDEIIVAIPTATRKQIQTVIAECNKTNCKVRMLPSIGDLIDGNVSVNALRDVDLEDLLGRDPVKLNVKEISGYLEGRIVLVTGGGGSIGSELCRQIARYNPRRLIALDNYENGVFELGGELKATFPELEFETVICSVHDLPRMRRAFEKYKPHVVFHAAAHKHVPLMEFNPGEAVVNNVLGTKYVTDLADEYAAERFVMISTDKAVNPTNVMGATKRLAEMIVQSKSGASKTAFAVVRFGNVLGSNGSVIPIFRKQIERGGPLTVTDKDVTRYFMTIPEAVQLVIQAGAMTRGGEIFILDMGEPVRIMDLAENIVRLSGLVPYEDIDIVITGLRPGEKLIEELSYENEFLEKTLHEKIFLGTATAPTAEMSAMLKGSGGELEAAILQHIPFMSDGDVKKWIGRLLPNYNEAGNIERRRGIRIPEDQPEEKHE